MEALARNLHALREQKGYSAAQVAQSLEITEDGYNRIESGEIHPTIPILKQLADILGTTIPDLLTGQHAQQNVASTRGGHFSAQLLSETDKDTYIKILENQLRVLLSEKRAS